MKKSLLETHPQIALEWHPMKNGNLTPFDVTYGIAVKIWWQCSKGHEWFVSLNSRTNGNKGCPYCVNRKVCIENSLGVLNKNLAKEWHPTKNDLTPFNVSLHYGKKIWWQCSKGHEWQTTVDKRSNNRGCPYCSNRKINGENSFEAKNPVVAKEWHPIKNGNLKPSEVAPNCGKKVWWQCKYGHEWLVRICDRNWSGCPECKSSKSQKKLFNIVKEIFPEENIKYNYKDGSLRYADTNCCLQLDIYLPNKKIAIEYQGEQHFKPVKYWGGIIRFNRIKDRDANKKIICEKNGIKLIEVPYTWRKDKQTILNLLEGV